MEQSTAWREEGRKEGRRNGEGAISLTTLNTKVPPLYINNKTSSLEYFRQQC